MSWQVMFGACNVAVPATATAKEVQYEIDGNCGIKISYIKTIGPD